MCVHAHQFLLMNVRACIHVCVCMCVWCGFIDANKYLIYEIK